MAFAVDEVVGPCSMAVSLLAEATIATDTAPGDLGRLKGFRFLLLKDACGSRD